MADIDVNEIFASNGSLAEISPSEWEDGWVSIVGGIHGRPTAQQFNRVFNALHSFIANNHNSIESVKKTAGGAVQSDDFTGDTILSKLLEVDGSGSGLDSDKLDGRDGSYYAKETESVHTYAYSYENKTHYFIGSGAIGRVRIMHEFDDGDVIKIGPSKSAAVTVNSFMGVDPVEEFAVDRWYQFVYDKNSKGKYEINFKSGRVKVQYVVNHWMQKSGGDGYTLDSTVTFEGIKGKVVSPDTINVDGYVTPASQSVKLGRNTVVDYYYNRNIYEYVVYYFFMGVDGKYPSIADDVARNTAAYGSIVSITPESKTGFATPDKVTVSIGTGENNVNVYYARNAYPWSVFHYLQNVNANGYDLNTTDSGTALYGSKVFVPAKAYTGFSSPDGQTITIGTENNNVSLHYSRKSYMWTASHYKQNVACNGYDLAEAESGTALYGSVISVSSKSYTGFASTANKTITIAAANNTIRFDYKRNSYSFVVRHYQQNVSGSGYSLADTDRGSAPYGASVTPGTKSYNGFSRPGTKSITMEAKDAEISYQYSRNKYNVTCIDVCGSTELGRNSWNAYFGSVVYGSYQGTNSATHAYHKNYAYTGCSKATVGTSGATVYRYFDYRVVTLRNMLSDDCEVRTTWSDVGLHDNQYDKKSNGTYGAVAGHRYYARARVEAWAYDYNGNRIEFTACARVNGNDIVEISHSTGFNAGFSPTHSPYPEIAEGYIVFTSNSSTIDATPRYKAYLTSQGSLGIYLEMLVDITELENKLGYQISSDTFNSWYGKFYGSKTVVV